MNSPLNEKPSNQEGMRGYKPHILVVIVERSKSERVVELFHKKNIHVHFSYVSMAEGTASSDIMDLLGLGSTDKSVFFSLIPGFFTTLLLDSLREDLNLQRAKKGIAFTIPLSGVSSNFLQLIDKVKQEFLQINGMDTKKEEVSINDKINAPFHGQMGEDSIMNISHDLIVAVINQGYSDDLMDAARKAGATGGTVFHARHIGTEDTSSFFGIAIQAEKEIVAILTRRDNKHNIMQAISQSSGIKTKAGGVVFSLPVDGVAGLDSEMR